MACASSAISVLAAAVYVVLSHAETDDLRPAMALASFSPDKRSTSAVVSELLGARHGSPPTLERGAVRLELAAESGALATDLAMAAMLTPLANEPDRQAWSPSWGCATRRKAAGLLRDSYGEMTSFAEVPCGTVRSRCSI